MINKVVFILVITTSAILLIKQPKRVVIENSTVVLCRDYAKRDHSMEIGKQRFDWLSQWGDPNDEEFFFESCIGHITGVPATKEYLK